MPGSCDYKTLSHPIGWRDVSPQEIDSLSNSKPPSKGFALIDPVVPGFFTLVMEMNVTSYVLELASQITSTPPTAVPGILINNYARYLWNYEPNSWVAKIASLSRVLAIICALPVVILGLLVSEVIPPLLNHC